MPNSFYLKNAKEKIRLASKPFAGGGEGNLYKITSPAQYKKFVAKIYHPPKQTALREQKINYLINHPPHEAVNDPKQHSPIVWITDGLYKNNKFVGFIMPFVSGEKLEILCLSKLPKKLSAQWKRFDRNNPKSWNLRLRICFNLATAIYQIHSADRYVLVDLKPDNVIVQPNGLISIVDTDSVEVIENGRAIFPAPVATPEYTPAEFYSNTHRINSTVGESWDRFGLAVIFYKLMLGIHPFTASSLAPYDRLVSLHNKIEHGLFVFAKDKQQYIQQPIPAPHNMFLNKLNSSLKDLFINCFTEGHSTPALRPTAEQWCYALLDAMNDDRIRKQFEHLISGLSKRRKGFRMPSSMLKALVLNTRPDSWIDKLIDQDFEVPQLPAKVHSQLNKIAPKKAVLLDSTDIIMSWLAFIAAVGLLFVTSAGWWTWLTETIWTYNALIINLFFIILLLLPQLVIPFIIYAGRSLIDPEKKTFNRLQELKQLYPKYKQKVLDTKQTFFNYIAKETKQHQDFYAGRKRLRNTTEQFLKIQDEQIQRLLAEEQDTLAELEQKYVAEAKQNTIIKELKANTLDDIRKELVKAETTAINTTRQNADYNEKVRTSLFYQNRMDKVVAEAKKKHQKIEDWAFHRKTQLEKGLEEDKALLLSPFDMQNNFIENKDKFIPGNWEDRTKVLHFFNINGLKTISQIEEVLPEHILLLKDGRRLDLKTVNFTTRSSFCYKMASELPKIKKQVENLEQSIQALERRFSVKKKQLDVETQFQRETLEKELKEQKKAIFVIAEKEYYQEKYKNVLKSYHNAVHWLKGTRDKHSRMVDNIATVYSERYKSILKTAEEQVDKAKLKIEQFEIDYRQKIYNLIEQSRQRIKLPDLKERSKIEKHIRRLNK